MCLGKQVGDRVELQSRRPARTSPRHRSRGPRGVHAGAGRKVGEGGQQQSTVQRGRRRVQRIRQCCIGFAVGPALPDEAGPRRQVQPGRRDQVPAHRGGRLDESIGGQRWRPVGTGPVEWIGFGNARRDQPRRGGDLQDEAEPVVVDPGALGQTFQFADSEAAAAEFGNRRAGQRFRGRGRLRGADPSPIRPRRRRRRRSTSWPPQDRAG